MRIRKRPIYDERRVGAESCRLDVWDPYQMWRSRLTAERAEYGAGSLLRELFERR